MYDAQVALDGGGLRKTDGEIL